MPNLRRTRPLLARRLTTRLLPTLLVVAAVVASVSTRAATIRAALTDLSSNTERMISYRHQEHMWQSSDGALHLAFNRGTLQPNPGLSLYSSFDGGSTWVFMQSFPNTDEKSTMDGQLSGAELSLAYATAEGNIVFTELHYESSLRTWSVTRSDTAFTSAQLIGLNPAHAIDSLGTVWCAFVARDRATNDTNIRLINRPGGGNLWTDPRLAFGPTDHRSIERSARPIRVPGGMGMVFTVRESTYWATRTDTLPDNSAWSVSTVFVGSAEPSYKDAYASHFSVVADDQNTLHLVIAENYDILYLRSVAASGSWSTALKIDDDRKAVYSQMGLANGKVAVPFSVQRGKGALKVSADAGASFALAAELALLPAGPGLNFGTARVEMPTRSNGALAVLQQYEDNGVQRMMLFKVPVP